MKFIDLCDRLRILLLVLSSHFIHRLQPLNVSFFTPLTIYYTNNLNQLLHNSLGMINISKRAF